jgi:methionyl-tRNA formyltransferase
VVRIAFFGTPAFAVPSLERLLAEGEEVVVVVTQPDRPRGRGHRVKPSPVKVTGSAHNIPILQPERARDPQFARELATYDVELGVVVAYGQILPDAILNTPAAGLINVHASLLPRYRGAAPIQRAVIAGEIETGITMIRLIREMDAGPILARLTRPIHNDETSEELESALAMLGAGLLQSTVQAVASGQLREEPQNHALATFAPRITKEDGLIDWSKPARSIHNLVRGICPWPRAFTFFEGNRLLIHRTSIETSAAAFSAGAPGELLEASDDRLLVTCGAATVLAIQEIQAEGGRVLPTRSFLAGRTIKPGECFQASPNQL